MERTGIKLTVRGQVHNNSWAIVNKDGTDGKAFYEEVQTRKWAEQFVERWNAFEEGGPVDELLKECEKVILWLQREEMRCNEQAKLHEGKFDSLRDALLSDSRNYKLIANNLEQALAEAKEGAK